MYVSNTIQASISQLNATGIDADLNMGANDIIVGGVGMRTAWLIAAVMGE